MWFEEVEVSGSVFWVECVVVCGGDDDYWFGWEQWVIRFLCVGGEGEGLVYVDDLIEVCF